jgi:thiol-disulfide isomerase/thioredoxin
MKNNRLIMFYADNCEPCVVMNLMVERLEKEHAVKVDRLEVWFDKENQKLLEKYAGLSTVPFFYNERSGEKISGETDFDTLERWALGKYD